MIKMWGRAVNGGQPSVEGLGHVTAHTGDTSEVSGTCVGDDVAWPLRVA